MNGVIVDGLGHVSLDSSSSPGFMTSLQQPNIHQVKDRTGQDEGKKANYINLYSEPHSPHFLVRTTSEYSSFDYFVLKSFQFLKIKLFFLFKMDRVKNCNDYIMLESSNP